MEDVKKRLQETSQNCLQAYDVWCEKKTSQTARESMLAAIHELRKVASRLEIDLAVSERNDMGSKPLPIPAHRAALDSSDYDDDEGHGNKQDGSGPAGGSNKPPRRRRNPGGKPQGE